MKGFFSKLKKNKKGYTLTELIVVVAILGVLAAIAVPMVLNSIQDSKEKADQASIKAIETAVQLCLADGTLEMKIPVSGGTQKEITPKGSVGSGDIDDAVAAKLVGGVYPINNSDNSRAWYLDKKTGAVFTTGTGHAGAETLD